MKRRREPVNLTQGRGVTARERGRGENCGVGKRRGIQRPIWCFLADGERGRFQSKPEFNGQERANWERCEKV